LLDAERKHSVALEPTARHVWSIAWPMIAAYSSVPIMGLMGVAVMGHLENPRYLAGVGLATNFFAFFYFIFAFVRWSTTGLSAQAAGRAAARGNDDNELSVVLLRSMGLGLLIGVLLLFLREPLARVALELLTDSAVLRSEAVLYAQWRFLGAPALLGTYALTGWFIGSKRPKAVLVMTLATNATHLLILLIAINGLGLRSAGAGAAAALAEWTGLIIGIVMALRTGKVHVKRHDLRTLLNRHDVRALFTANANVLVKTLFTIAIFFSFLGISGRFDPVTFGANVVLLQMFYLCSYVMDGFANACEALAGQAEGAGRPESIDAIVRMCLQCSLVTAGIFALTYGAFGHVLIAAISDLQQINATAERYRLWMTIVPLALAGATIFDGVFVGTLRLRELRNSAILATIGFGLLCAVALPLLANHGLWLSFTAYFVMRQAAGFTLYRRSQLKRLAVA
jgi:multidrug resistance protein, MATE family